MKNPLRNKVTEKDLRDHLAATKYYPNSARVHELELVGIERPGWVQVFRCHVEAKHEDDGWQELFGVIRDDERSRCEVHLFDDRERQQTAIDDLTVGLLQRPGSTSAAREPLSKLALFGMTFVGLLVSLLAYAQLFGTPTN